MSQCNGSCEMQWNDITNVTTTNANVTRKRKKMKHNITKWNVWVVTQLIVWNVMPNATKITRIRTDMSHQYIKRKFNSIMTYNVTSDLRNAKINQSSSNTIYYIITNFFNNKKITKIQHILTTSKQATTENRIVVTQYILGWERLFVIL